MSGKNPCDICKAKTRASECDGCVFDTGYISEPCATYGCMLNREGSCLVKLDEVCKASTGYLDDIARHDCGECVNYRTDSDGFGYCEMAGNEAWSYDDACEDFEERIEE